MTTSNTPPRPLLVLLAVLGVVAFLYGITQGNPLRTWSIYLINLLFWSSLAITGPAIAGMVQVTEGRWSPSIKRIALTTAGSASRVIRFRGHLAFTFVTARELALIPRMRLSRGFRAFGYPPACPPSYGASDSYPGRSTSC